MPGPQLEHGYVRIANELFDAILRYGFSKRELSVLLAIVRKTYGYGKKTDDMTVQQIANMTSIPRQHVSATISELCAKNAVLKRDGRHGYVLGINKDYGAWQPSQNRTRPETGRGASQNRTVTVLKQDTQKTTPKDNPKRQRSNGLDGFADWYARYPRHEKRQAAERAWSKLSEADRTAAVDALAWWPFPEDVTFVPHPSSWLNGRRWEDERTPKREGRGGSVRPTSAVDRVERANRTGRYAEPEPDGTALDADGADVRPPMAERLR